MTTAPSSLAATLVSRTRPLDDPGDLLGHLGAGGFCWLRDGAGFVTAGVAARLAVGPGAGRFERAAAEVGRLLGGATVDDPVALPGTGPLAVGALPFGETGAGELVVPAVVVGRHPSGSAWITETAPQAAGTAASLEGPGGPRPPDGEAGPAERPDRSAWTEAVRRVLGAIDAGHLRKVVLAREVVVSSAAPLDRAAVLARLAAAHPTCFTYAAGGFVGASPELLVRRLGASVSSCPMAGTVRRGEGPDEDDALVAALRGSAKDAAEHALLVEAVVAALAPVCLDDGPSAGAPEVVRLANVSHLATRVEGTLAEPWPSVLSLVGRLHPTPAVAGTPRPAALAAIAALEGLDRGRYAGPVGWVDARGEGEWAIALRGAELDGTRARLMAGAGIVAGSDPGAEWAETEAKLAAMRAAVGA